MSDEGVDRAAVRARAEAVLRRLAGESARLREDQWRAIEALVVDRRRVLCVQRTGWGKSAVYFVATALLRDRDSDSDRDGAGLNLRTGRPSAQKVRRAVHEVLSRPEFRRRAGELGARMTAAGGVPRAGDLIEALLPG